jgi:hypothetical protein
METINIKAYTTDTSQVDAIKAFMKTLKIKYEVLKEEPYDQEFVDKILQGDKDYEAGKGKKVILDDLNKLWK